MDLNQQMIANLKIGDLICVRPTGPWSDYHLANTNVLIVEYDMSRKE